MIAGRLIGGNVSQDGNGGEGGAPARPFRSAGVEMPYLAILGEQAHPITEPKYADKIIYGWMKSVPTQSVADRLEADRRSVTRQMERAFA